MANKIIAWDYDGVLNNNIRDGRFVWADTFEADLGHDHAEFQRQIFGENLRAIFTGQIDLIEVVQDWADEVGYAPGALALLDYWFSRDQMLDPALLHLAGWLKSIGITQCVATNNESRRATFIMEDPAMSATFDTIFASGRLGVGKPDAEFFSAVTRSLGADPVQMILIDDLAENIVGARACGWDAYHITDETRLGLSVYLSSVLDREVPLWGP